VVVQLFRKASSPGLFRALIALGLFCILEVHLSVAANYFSGVSPATPPWANGIVPYVFDPAFPATANQQAVILSGLREWELVANVKFIPRTTETHYVLLQFTNDSSGTGEYLNGTPATLTLHGLARGLLCHESGHLFGLAHEHQRKDSTNYIVLNTNNVISGALSEFVVDPTDIPFGNYDFESVMHYSPGNFSSGGDTLDPLPAYQKYYHKIGNLTLSLGDRAAATNLYGPPLVPLTNIVLTTADGGTNSLRAAIYYANSHPGTTIRFNIPTSDPGFSGGIFTIHLSGELPPLVSPGTVIDATTQPGFAGTPIVVLDGSQVLPEVGPLSGLHLYGTNCLVRAMAFNNFNFSGVQFFCSDSVSNRVQGCYVGLKPDGATAASNNFAGLIFQFGPHDNFIGGTNTAQRNIISGNTLYGVVINDTGSDHNTILGNYIGINAAGTAGIANGKSGVAIWSDPKNTVIGGTNSGAGNVISGNREYGVYIAGSNVLGNVVLGNYLGTDATGSYGISNFIAGVGVFQASHNNQIGGTNVLARNLISGNGSVGVYFADGGTSNNFVLGNYLGVNASGTTAISNVQADVFLIGGAAGNTIGGTSPGAGNILSGSPYGVYLQDFGSSNNVILGNLIGTDLTGKIGLGDSSAGIGIWNGAGGNILGGNTVAALNVISGNIGSYGVAIGTANGNVIEGNLIGTDVTGTNALPNAYGVGIFNGSQQNIVGGSTAGSGNVLSGNATYDVFISAVASANLVQGNIVGLDPTGTRAVPNTSIGVALFVGATNNLIGGTTAGTGNLIASNLFAGIAVFQSNTTNNSFRGNSIYGNGGIGIDLNNDSITPDDTGDADTGPNNYQNFPVITNTYGFSTTTVVLGKLNSLASHTYALDFFSSPVAVPLGGKSYLGSMSVTTDGSGNSTFAYTNSDGNLTGQYITTTATIDTGDTSEFSAAVLATNRPSASAVFTNNVVFTRANGLAVVLNLATNYTYRIQAATNLAANPIAWVDLTNFTAITSIFIFSDHSATNTPQRFYRAVSP